MATITNQRLDVQDELLKALAKVDRPSAVCTSGDRPLTMPGLEVGEHGALSLPLGKAQARKLIKQCRQAPYGKGMETLAAMLHEALGIRRLSGDLAGVPTPNGNGCC